MAIGRTLERPEPIVGAVVRPDVKSIVVATVIAGVMATAPVVPFGMRRQMWTVVMVWPAGVMPPLRTVPLRHLASATVMADRSVPTAAIGILAVAAAIVAAARTAVVAALTALTLILAAAVIAAASRVVSVAAMVGLGGSRPADQQSGDQGQR